VFESDKRAEYFLQWTQLIGGIVNNLPHGIPLEIFLDNYLARDRKMAATRPDFLNDEKLDLEEAAYDQGEAPAHLGASQVSTEEQSAETAAAHVREIDEQEQELEVQDPELNPNKYQDLSKESQELDKALFQSLLTIVQGSYADLLSDLRGDYGRYTFAMIAMWQHAQLGSSNRRLTAMTKMQDLQFHGDAGKWKIDFMNKAREVFASKVTIEHWVMQCAFKSFEGKNTQVQAMMVNDINSAEIVFEGMNMEKLATKYCTFVSTMAAGKSGGGKIHNAQQNLNITCYNCNKKGHLKKDCPDRLREKSGKGGKGGGKGGKGGDKDATCDHCGKKGHKKAQCFKLRDEKKAAKDAEDAKKVTPPAAAQSAQLSDSAIADLCTKLKSGEFKLALNVSVDPDTVTPKQVQGEMASQSIFSVSSEKAKEADAERVALSLCDGMGCLALALKDIGFKELGLTKYIAVEKDASARKVCEAANPQTDDFPGVVHGLNGRHDIFQIAEADIASITDQPDLLIAAGPECNDFSKLRLLPNRPGFKGPPRDPNVDPRPGLGGPHGKTFRQTIKIIGWAQKHHPDTRYFVENVEFMDMADDWAEVCDALGEPFIIDAHDHSYTKRRRAYWTNINVPEEFKQGYPPLEPNDCLDKGRRVQKYAAKGRMCTRPLGASWKGDAQEPEAATGRPQLVIDSEHREPQQLRPEEAERLMGMEAGTTAGAGITPIMRMKCIGGGWDLNIVKMLLKHLKPTRLHDQAKTYLVKLGDECSEEQLAQGKMFYEIQQGAPKVFAAIVRSVAEQKLNSAAKVMALAQFYSHTISLAEAEHCSVLDSGAARHIHPKVTVKDGDDRCRLTSFTGEERWTEGNGYIPMTLQDDQTDELFSWDIQDADYLSDVNSPLLSLCKLIREGWKFDLEWGSLYAYTPTGRRITLHIGRDNVLKLPHSLREGDAAAELLQTHQCNRVKAASKEAATAEYLHRLFNHANPDKVHRTLGATSGFKQPTAQMPGCHCEACAQGNARKRGLKHSSYCVFSAVESQMEGDSSTEEADYEDFGHESQNDETIRMIEEVMGGEFPWPINEAQNLMAPANMEEDYESDFEMEEAAHEMPEYKFVAQVAGRTTEASVPRFDIDLIKPFEIMFADEKAYDSPQRGGWTTSFVMVDLKSDAWFKIDETAKTQHGDSFQKIIINNQIHLLPYERTIYTDGCGSMRHVRDRAVTMGINHVFIPPYDQSLNEAERIADRAFATARTHLVSTGATEAHTALAVDHACYMKLRMATTAKRGYLTPYEIIKGVKPNIAHCMPFFIKVHVTVPKEKRIKLKKEGKGHLRAEDGYLVGYQDIWGTTPKILLEGNRVIHSRNVTYEIDDYGLESVKREVEDSSAGAPPPSALSNADIFEDLLEEHVTGVAKPKVGLTGNHDVHDNPLHSPSIGEGDGDAASPSRSLHSPSSTPTWLPNVSIEYLDVPAGTIIGHDGVHDSPPWRWKQEAQDISRGRTRGQTAQAEPRDTFLATMDKIIRLEHKFEIFSAKLSSASQKLNKDFPDVGAHLVAAAEFAAHAQKDMNWKKALESDQKQDALAALDKELTSLQKTILTAITPEDKDWEIAVKTATPGRLLLDIKRSGKHKCRGVKQGFRENKEQADGVDFNYYSNVVKLNAVRIALFSKRSGHNRQIGIKDVSTAFLQSDSYEKGVYKYICFKHPVTLQWIYYRQSGPIYGEASAPARWENTVAPWFVDQGFIRGENERGVFYHPERDLLVLLYVDDVMASGEREDVDWIFTELEERFECKDADFITDDTPQDYLGMIVAQSEEWVYLSMSNYIKNACEILNITAKGGSTPITQPIDPESEPLRPQEVKDFLTAVGMLGWLANTVRCDVAYAYSRIAQHSATPTQSALAAVRKTFAYLKGTHDLCLCAEVYDPDRNVTQIMDSSKETPVLWRFYTDSDHAGNSEVQNKRRSQNGLMVVHNGAPVLWASKASSVAFACKSIGEAHADMSSGAAEVYAAGNASLEILALSYVVDEMGIEFPLPFILEMDNDAARIFTNATAMKTKMKHIDCRQEWVRTLRDKSVCLPAHVPTADNLADIFTKILDKETFERLRDSFMTVFNVKQ
jgi:hypothetical protein